MCSGLWEEKESWDSPPHMSGNKTYVRNSGWLREGHFLEDLAGGQFALLVVVVHADGADAAGIPRLRAAVRLEAQHLGRKPALHHIAVIGSGGDGQFLPGHHLVEGNVLLGFDAQHLHRRLARRELQAHLHLPGKDESRPLGGDAQAAEIDGHIPVLHGGDCVDRIGEGVPRDVQLTLLGNGETVTRRDHLEDLHLGGSGLLPLRVRGHVVEPGPFRGAGEGIKRLGQGYEGDGAADQ